MATPRPRTTPGINQPTVNKTYKNTSNSSSYIGNIGKEIKEYIQAWSANVDATDKAKYSRVDDPLKKSYEEQQATKASNRTSQALGQLGGAILGKKYDAKGKQTNKGKK